MSIQQGISSQVYKMADAAQTPEQIRSLQGLLTKSIQDGALPSYVGVPLLGNLNQRLQQVATMNAPQQQQQQPPIADEILQQAQHSQQQGLNGLKSNLPVEGMYDGGIVALAAGGDVDDYDPEDERIEEAEYMQALQHAQDNTASMLEEGSPRGFAAATPTAGKEINRTPNIEQNIQKEDILKGHGIEQIIAQAAKQHNLPPELMRNIAMAESSLNPNAASNRSSAKGLYQFIDSTWAGMGGKQGEQFDPARNAELGAAFTRKNAEYLKNALGRDPTYGEVYAAHFFGPGTARQLASADQSAGIDAALGNRANAVISANPHLRGKTVGDVFGGLSKKAGEGIVALAGGGAVQHFDKGGINAAGNFSNANSDDPLLGGTMSPTDLSLMQKDNPNAFQRLMRGLTSGPYDGYNNSATAMTPSVRDMPFTKQETPAGAAITYRRQHGASNAPPVSSADLNKPWIASEKVDLSKLNTPYDQLTNDSPNAASQGDIRAFENAQQSRGSTAESSDQAVRDAYRQAGPAAPAEGGAGQPPASARSPFDDYMERMTRREEDLKQQKEEDKYMSLLAAGLGMMGGTSPFAGANIGQGALAGVANYAQAAKLRGAEQAGIDKNVMMANRYKELGDVTRQSQDLMMKRFGISEADRVAAQQAATQDRNARLVNEHVKNVLLNNPQVKAAVTEEDKAKAMEKAQQEMIADPFYRGLYKKAFPELELPSANAYAGYSIVNKK